jgi:acetyl-CoA synthetase
VAEKTYSPPRDLLNPFIKNLDEYNEMYQSSIEDPQNFFGEQAKENLDWVEPFSSVHNNEFVDSKWFEGGKINIAYNCIDRHLKTAFR